jgi:hypothetical protein
MEHRLVLCGEDLSPRHWSGRLPSALQTPQEQLLQRAFLSGGRWRPAARMQVASCLYVPVLLRHTVWPHCDPRKVRLAVPGRHAARHVSHRASDAKGNCGLGRVHNWFWLLCCSNSPIKFSKGFRAVRRWFLHEYFADGFPCQRGAL